MQMKFISNPPWKPLPRCCRELCNQLKEGEVSNEGRENFRKKKVLPIMDKKLLDLRKDLCSKLQVTFIYVH